MDENTAAEKAPWGAGNPEKVHREFAADQGNALLLLSCAQDKLGWCREKV